MTDTNQKQLGNTLWSIADQLRGGSYGPLSGRHEAPAVVGRFIFFRDLAFFGDSERSGFVLHYDDETGLPPLNPLVLRTENRQKFYRQKFFWRF